ncbi:MAG: D-alanyl-D-alanine carboxypeptidase/D-alanyl-D-alanine-endopeptidase, partial [Armatimonadetes bacterium]|nr:D-alanyl-D-alanine carboxypeptidase/D-alanyl-D-alanine-endopeptidase [Armatimonadota bacterium]
EPFYYSPQVSGLNCDGNVVVVGVAPAAKLGDPVAVTINGRPADEETYLTVENAVRTVAVGKEIEPEISFDRVRGQNRVLLSGTIPVGAKAITEEITVENPARFAASRLVLALVKAGVAVDTPLWVETGKTPANATELAATVSKPLSVLLSDFLKPSDNLFGECLLKTVGAKTFPGKPGSVAGGRVAILALLKNAGIGTGGLNVADGSGLSLQNTVTPRLMCDLLTWADTKLPPADRAVFLNALPVSGTSGTIRNRLKGTPLVGKVRGKTGTLSGASSLSGYLTAKSGERFVFSVLMNHYGTGASDARAAQDAIVTALYER